MRGTLINTGTVLVGSTIGALSGQRLPAGIRTLLLQAIGLMTLIIGLQRALETTNILVLLGSVVVGGIAGELLRIERGLERLGELMNEALARIPGIGVADKGPSPPPQPSLVKGEGAADDPVETDGADEKRGELTRGFVTASLIFCVGPMTILGSIEDGLSGTFETLALKATLDGVTSAVLASTLGWGVILSAATVLLFQGGLTLGAGLARGLLTEPMIGEMTAAGGLLILGIGLNILQLTRIPVGNLLPALVVAPALVALSGSRGG